MSPPLNSHTLPAGLMARPRTPGYLMASSRTRRTPGSTSSVTMPESSSSVVMGDGEGEAVTAAGAISSPRCVVRTPDSRKPPNSATMAPATTNLVALNMDWNLHLGDWVAVAWS